MSDRIENFRYETGVGTVLKLHPVAWEVDVLAGGASGIVYRAMVLGPRFPEVSTPKRPQYVLYGCGHSSIGFPWCLPIPSRLFSAQRGNFVYWDEALNWRITINRDNEVEILHPTKHYHILLQEKDGVIRVETPRTRLVLKDADGSALLECEKQLTVHCEDAVVNVEKDAKVTVGASATIDVKETVDVTAKIANVTAPAINLNGLVTVT